MRSTVSRAKNAIEVGDVIQVRSIAGLDIDSDPLLGQSTEVWTSVTVIGVPAGGPISVEYPDGRLGSFAADVQRWRWLMS